MRLPTPKFLASKEISVQIGQGTDENGALKIDDKFDVKGRVEQNNSVIHTKDGTKVSLKAKAYIFSQLDKFPNDTSGTCTIDDVTYEIVNTSKKLCPDGSVHHIVLELI